MLLLFVAASVSAFAPSLRPRSGHALSAKDDPLADIFAKVNNALDGISGDGGESPLDLLPPEYKAVYPNYVKEIGIDCAALVAFATVGRLTHFENPINIFADVLTAVPFILAWLALAAPLNAYSEDMTDSYRKALHNVGPPAVASAVLGSVIRGVGKFSLPSLPFVIVSTISVTAFLFGGRGYQVYQKTGELPSSLSDVLPEGIELPAGLGELGDGSAGGFKMPDIKMPDLGDIKMPDMPDLGLDDAEAAPPKPPVPKAAAAPPAPAPAPAEGDTTGSIKTPNMEGGGKSDQIFPDLPDIKLPDIKLPW